ncbi:hypothetical protein [Bacillus haikouensis]|uniref:hypothetical protein n=1 Tax=Bacillus haikouensis TaxID=1510468 RepID=UPI00155294D5|nr:hypothetical protein [Bacillus haikouensis]
MECKTKTPDGKAEGLCTKAGGIRRSDLEGVLCLLGRIGLCRVPLSPAARTVPHWKRMLSSRQREAKSCT